MELSTKVGIAFAAAAGAAAVASLFGRRPRHPRSSVGGLGGTWSDSVEKLATREGSDKKGVIVSWALPPGPVPAEGTAGARGGLQEICKRAGDKKGLYRLRQDPWEVVAKRVGMSPTQIAKLGKAGRVKLAASGLKPHQVNERIQELRTAAVAKHLGVSEEEARKRMPTGLDKLHKRVGDWWKFGTCPGCSEQCSRSCYVAKTQSSYFGSQRQMWGNVCDVVAGRGLPEIHGDSCAAGNMRDKSRPCSKKDAMTLVGRADDAPSRDLVVDSRKVDAAYVRVHVSGDFFDRAYASAWLDHARAAVARYKREYVEWQSGARREPPLRVHYWAYTRSWRIDDPKHPRQGRPDPGLLDVIRTFPTLEYPAEYWPAWAGENAGKLRRPAKQTFAVLLSADSSTGIPWVKDKRNRIMPVSFVLTESDLSTVGADGRPVVHDWDTKIPGIVLRDHSLRKKPKSPTSDWESGKGQFWCPMEDPGVAPARKKEIGGCFNCRLCLPDTSQKVADVMFKRYAMGWSDGESFALMEAAKRGSPLDWYEKWQKDGPVFQLAVPPVATTFTKITEANKRNIAWWMKVKLGRLPLVGE